MNGYEQSEKPKMSLLLVHNAVAL